MTARTQDRERRIREAAHKMGVPDDAPIISRLIRSDKTLDQARVELANHALSTSKPTAPTATNCNATSQSSKRDRYGWGRVFARVREEARNA